MVMATVKNFLISNKDHKNLDLLSEEFSIFLGAVRTGNLYLAARFDSYGAIVNSEKVYILKSDKCPYTQLFKEM